MSKVSVLFLCTGNSCRSQMAEGLLRHLAGDRFEAASAGTHPVGLNPLAIAVMREIGIDISKQRSKHVDECRAARPTFVITVCDRARESCPVFTGAPSHLHWGFEDPAAASGSETERMIVFRRVRDEVRDRIHQFLEESALESTLTR